MIKIDNSFYFKKEGLNLNENKDYLNYLKISKNKSSELIKEFESGQNQILQSFTKSYQKKIRDIGVSLKDYNKKKVIIGFGGSSSGAKAMSFFLQDEIIYFDNLDYSYLKNFLITKNLKDYTFYIISKSGNTFETLAILNLLILECKKKNYDIFESVIIITDKNENLLRKYAVNHKIKIVNHNFNIGGRFSVLSETGMLPFVDLKINFENGSEKFLSLLTKEDQNSPTLNVAIIATCIKKYKLNLYCNLLYNYKLKHFSYWFHQLHAESLGKNNQGLTPYTSICPKDHHSMMQLYLGGRKDKIFNIFSPSDEVFFEKFSKEGFKNIENYDPQSLLFSQFKAVTEVFEEKGIPHRIINIQNYKDPLSLIELFSYFILETILLGKVLNIEPYGQPEVQLIKDKIYKD
jgi:glucose-6-phosphate isomerase